ncbi:sodium:solute symporter [Clostridiales bacterium TF09-2AC]|uniref:sodium:solute symporter family transporter n=1 Tax=Enterocloster hominis (ex Hitch et al. 2024) TaxID=1917870 RepID=UPI000E71BD6C|nr:sodium/solute symporter [Lachnoclostridium pacaense]RJW48942.1 sodium:solute symporter [Clostridiales bacterium TF09-2AC]
MVSNVDILVIIGYFLCLLIIGFLTSRQSKEQEEYLIARKSMPWLPVALSVTATMISANGFIGGPGWAYTSGMYPVMVNVAVPLAVFFALYIAVPVIYHLNINSIYQYMELRLGKYTKALSIFQFFVNSIIQASSMVFVPVLVLQRMTGWPMKVLVPAVVLVAVIYTLMGGIKAVIWTDALQMFVVIGAVIFVVIAALSDLDVGIIDFFDLARTSGKLSTLDFSFDITNNNTFWVTLIGGTFMWVRYFCFDQTQVQRVLTSKSLKQAKKSLALSAFIMNIVYYLMLFIGVILFFFYKGRPFESANDVMITFIMEEVPIGITGLILAGVFAAAMSSVDSLINSMVLVFTKDIYEPYLLKKKASLKTTRYITLVIGIIMIGVIFVGFGNSVRSVLDLVGNYISYFAGPAAGAFLLGFFTLKANDKGVAVGVIAGIIGNTAIAMLLQTGWLWNPAIGATITIVVGYACSLGFGQEKSPETTRKYTVMGMKNDLRVEKNMRPCYFGVGEMLTLGFFLLQYVFFFLIK